ncbi:MAG TPA: phospholipid carrier-dependent glycosyltransferase [Vitreimonas sp.]|nr:phospholipid carrier-dependent glycosyltransferase [Vitreimonas sp.]
MKKWIDLVLLVLILSIAAGVRLYRVTAPLADWHSWRQADTASVTREYVKHNYPLTLSHFHDLSNIPSGEENPQGWRMVEFPIVNYLVAGVLRQWPMLDLVSTYRVFSIFASLIMISALYILVQTISNDRWLSGLTALIVALMPYSIFYSRVILPEPYMLAAQVLSLLAFVKWLQSLSTTSKSNSSSLVAWSWFVLSVACMALALLLKPPAIFIAPVFAIMAWWYLGWKFITTWQLYVYGVVALLPMLWWRTFIQDYAVGIPASDWLWNGNGIRLKPSWWRWLFADRIDRLMLGYWGSVFLFLGMAVKSAKDKWSAIDILSLSWFGSMVLYLVMLATGNVQHDYYQAMLVPSIALMVARGVVWYWRLPSTVVARWVVVASTVWVAALAGFLSWYEVRGYFNINNPAIVEAGKRVDALVPADALVIAPYQGDTAFLFQTNRRGWPIGGLIPQRIEQGASVYVTTALDDEAKALQTQYQTIEQKPEYLILDLSKPVPASASAR